LLRRRGIEVTPPKGTSHKDRGWWITRVPPQEDGAAQQPQQPPRPPPNDSNDLGGGDVGGDVGGDWQQPPQQPPVNPLKNKAGGDGGDRGDVAGPSSKGAANGGTPIGPPCNYCGGASVFPGDPTAPWDHPIEAGVLVWLHRRCEAPWFDQGHVRPAVTAASSGYELQAAGPQFTPSSPRADGPQLTPSSACRRAPHQRGSNHRL
jgi:hypothetical protein